MAERMRSCGSCLELSTVSRRLRLSFGPDISQRECEKQADCNCSHGQYQAGEQQSNCSETREESASGGLRKAICGCETW